jgi:AhpD family alkylhydroperoxidase
MYSMDKISKLKRIGDLAPEAFQAFAALDAAAVKDGAVPRKYKELIALGVALTTQCPYCLEIHRKNAKAAGATEQEIAETIMVAVSLRAGAAITHGTHLLE